MLLAAVSQMPEFKRSSTSSSSSSSSQGTSPPSSSSCLRSVDQIQEQEHQHHQHQQQQLRSSTADDLVVDVMTTSSNAAPAARSWLPLHQQYPSTGYYYTSFQQQQQQEYYHCPFTASQWAELEHQALIFKYMMARAPVPAELLNPIRRSLLSAAAAAVNGPHNLLAGGFQPGLGFSPLDLEPGRCRRTDGKKWRCSRPVVPEQKYCERHVNRGRNRSKKAKEAAAAAAAAAAAVNRTSQSNGSSCIGNGSSTSHASMKLVSQMAFNSSNEHQTTRYLDHGRTVQTQHFTQQRIQETGGGLAVACIAEADDEPSAAQLLLRRRAGAAGGGGVRATQALAA